MNHPFFATLCYLSLILCTTVYGGEDRDRNRDLSEIKQPTHFVFGLGFGNTSSTNLGRAQTFAATDPLTDEYYIYTPQQRRQSQNLFELFFGGENTLQFNSASTSTWILQAGLTYAQTSVFHPNGTLVQGVDDLSPDRYHYQYDLLTRQILAQAKLMYPYRQKYFPYILIGLGASFNKTTGFTTNVPPFLDFTRTYADNNPSSFASRLGFGVDVEVFNHIRLGLGYRFADLGSIRLGTATIDETRVKGTLTQANLLANEVLLQVTYIA